MDISNAIVPVNLVRPLNEGGGTRNPQSGADAAAIDATGGRRADRVNRESVDPDAFQRRVEQKQASQAVDINRFQSSEPLSLNSQQALTTYQQTEVASQEFDGGVLVGIDLFV